MLTGGEAARQEPLRIKTVSLSTPLRGTCAEKEFFRTSPPSVDPYKSLRRGGGGVWGGGGEALLEKGFSSPSPIFISTPYRSVQLTQGSMLLTMTGMSASWQSFIMTVRASQFM